MDTRQKTERNFFKAEFGVLISKRTTQSRGCGICSTNFNRLGIKWYVSPLNQERRPDTRPLIPPTAIPFNPKVLRISLSRVELSYFFFSRDGEDSASHFSDHVDELDIGWDDNFRIIGERPLHGFKPFEQLGISDEVLICGFVD